MRRPNASGSLCKAEFPSVQDKANDELALGQILKVGEEFKALLRRASWAGFSLWEASS